MTEVSIILKPIYRFALQTMDCFLYDRDLRHEKLIGNYFT